MQTSPRYVSCPVCSARVPWNASSPYRPFCSERCKLIDLGQWAAENYRIPQTETPEKPAEEQ
jgi:endogenous inhibitor of DNA gyrase (YacG/DUF329 family)